jgi:hypothetical protein
MEAVTVETSAKESAIRVDSTGSQLVMESGGGQDGGESERKYSSSVR